MHYYYTTNANGRYGDEFFQRSKNDFCIYKFCDSGRRKLEKELECEMFSRNRKNIFEGLNLNKSTTIVRNK